MISTSKLPACHRRIQGAQAADTLYSLAKYASPRHQGDIDAHEFHSLLCAAHIISFDQPLPQRLETVTCFRVVSEHHCGHLCPMCPYSLYNKNQLEAEESLLLSYALQNLSCFQYLQQTGLTAEHFQSLFLLNDPPVGKIVASLPLFRLAYSYISHMCTNEFSFKELPAVIASILDQNNRGKLLPKNVQSIKAYLERLQAQGSSIAEEKLKSLLSRMLYSNKNTETSTEKASEEETAPKTAQEMFCSVQQKCLDGLLGPHVTASDKHPQHSEVSNTVRRVEVPNDTTVSFPVSQAEPSSAPAVLTEESLFYPAVFSIHEADITGYPFHTISENAADLRQLETFLQFNPLVGIEIVTDASTKKKMVLLCAANQFYYVPANSEPCLSLFHLYFSKSSIRRQICMDSYQIYHFLQHNNIYYRNVYSLRTAYCVLSEAKGKKMIKKPSGMIKELASKENTYEYSPYIFSMLQYIKMFEVLSTNTLLNQRNYAQKLRVISDIEMFLGFSYELKGISDTQEPLFTLNESLEYQFQDTSALKLKEGIHSVTFTFSHKKPVQSLVISVLRHFSSKDLTHLYGYRLLRFSQDSFTIATTEEHYGLLCEIVANLSTYLAEKQGMVPLVVKENLENGLPDYCS